MKKNQEFSSEREISDVRKIKKNQTQALNGHFLVTKHHIDMP